MAANFARFPAEESECLTSAVQLVFQGMELARTKEDVACEVEIDPSFGSGFMRRKLEKYEHQPKDRFQHSSGSITVSGFKSKL